MIFRFPLQSATPIDGDTVGIVVDLGMHLAWTGNLRIADIDAPEMHDVRQRQAAISVTTAVRRWLFKRSTRPLVVRSDSWDKFGRLLGDIESEGEPSLGRHLMSQSIVKPYHGEAKSPWTEAELAAIVTKVNDTWE